MSTKAVPITIITGFLEAGKSSYIQHFLESDQTNRYEHILLLVCEEGETQYKSEYFHSECVQIVFLESIHSLKPEYISELVYQYRINRIIAECNGMWHLQDFIDTFPEIVYINEIITIMDASTYNLYRANLRSLMIDKLHSSHRIIVNRADAHFDRGSFRSYLSICAPKALIFYQYSDFELENDFREIPYALPNDANTLIISDDAFLEIYRDIFHNADAFDGKNIQVCGNLIRDPYGNFTIGRYTMVCCMEDLIFSGFVCTGANDLTPYLSAWVLVEGQLFTAYSRSYGQRGPILNLTSIKRALAPPDEITL